MLKRKESVSVVKFLWIFIMALAMPVIIGMTTKAANQPVQVTGLKQIGATSGSFEVEWKALLGSGINYQVEVSEQETGNYTLMYTAKYGTRSYIGGMSTGSTYYVRVRAYTSDDYGKNVYGEYSKPLEVVTAPDAAPSTIKHIKSTASSISLNWSKVSGANCYLVKYKKTSDSSQDYTTKTVKNNSINLTRLSKNQEYSVYVYAVRKSKANFTAVVRSDKFIAKHEIPITPGKTEGVKCQKYWKNSGSISLKCNKLKSADGYQWELYTSYKKKDTKVKSSYTKTYNGNSTFISHSALKKHKFYKVRARAYCTVSNGKKYYGSWSDWNYICQQPDVKLKNSSIGIKASWDKIDGAERYVVYVSNKPKSGYKKYCTTKKTSATISKYGSSKLKSGKKYYMYVIAQNKVGNKYYSGETGNSNSYWQLTYRK